MKNLYICSTPAQLINMVNLVVENHKADENYLYYLNHSTENEIIFNKLKEFDFFKSIFYIKTVDFNHHWTQKYKITRYIVKTFEYLMYKSISKRFFNNSTVYDNFYVSFMDRSSFIMFMDYKGINKNLKLHFISDGIGGYNLLTTKQNKIDNYILNLLGFKSVFEEMNSLYLYEKKLANNLYYSHIKLKELPKINNIRVKLFINKLFEYKLENIEITNYKYLYFQAPYTIDSILKSQFKSIQNFIKKLDKKFIIKLHPRTIEYKGIPQQYISNDKYPIEVLVSNYDISDKVLISSISAAAIMPKLMFDQEPYVIFLYKLFEQDKYTFRGDNYLEFLEKFKLTYRNKEKVFVPNNLEELDNILSFLESEKGI